MTLKTLTLTQPRIESDVLKYVVDDEISKAQEILAAGAGADNVADVGTVLGQRSIGALSAAYAARAGNTGNFINVFAVPGVAPGAKLGVYAVTFTSAVTFRVEDPDGIELGEGKTGVAFVNTLKFTITAGGVAAVVGDAADITITDVVGDMKMVPINFAATDGSQNFGAVALAKKIAPNGGADANILTLRRLGTVDTNNLLWPAGATNNQIAAAIAQMLVVMIVQRPS